MSVNIESAVTGFSRESLTALLENEGEGSIPAAARYDALARFEELPARESVRGGRAWKYKLAKLDFTTIAPFAARVGDVELEVEALVPAARRAGVTIERFSIARDRHRDLFERAFGIAVDTRDDKFASLALAFQNHGVFIDVPAGVALDEPLVIGYEARDFALFPYTLISLGANSRVSVIERLVGVDGAPLVCGIVEIVLAENARASYAADQRLPETTRVIMTRRAHLAAGAHLDVAFAELGSKHVVSRYRAAASGPGAHAGVVACFFSDRRQHVDIETETVHVAPDTSSETIVRSAGIGDGQGRYLGNIKILADAHGADASLRDDALLLSTGAHIDSVPALEIAANDVKAFHGATIGAISPEEIFYAQSRGIAREEAERMIALGFFEPAVSRFPGESLRDELRGVLANKIRPTVGV